MQPIPSDGTSSNNSHNNSVSASPTTLSKRKRARQPTSLTHDTLTPPTGLRYPTQLLHAARTGHTPLLHIHDLHTRFIAVQQALHTQLSVLPRPPPPPSLDDVRLQTPYRLIAERTEAEVAAVGEWMKEKESEVNEQQRRHAEQQEKQWNEQKRKEREERAERRRRDREAKAASSSTEAKEELHDGGAVKDERKEAEETSAADSQPIPAIEVEVQEEPTAAKETTTAETANGGQADDANDESKGARQRRPSKRPRRAARTFSASLSSPSTATSALQLSAGVDLPSSFGSSLPSHAELMAALLPAKALAALPLSLFPPVVDFNSLTPELFLHRLQKRLSERGEDSSEDAGSLLPPLLPPHMPLLRLSVYAAASDRKQQEIIVHGDQTLSELMAVIRCSAKQQPTSSSHSSFSSTDTPVHDPAAANTEFLYIERTLYPSPATPASALQPVVDFLTQHADTSPLYPPAIQQAGATKFMSLSVRLGSHYLYHHSTDCCHTVTVDGVEFLCESQHIADRRAYPLVVYERGDRRRLCGGCRMTSAVCCVYGDMLSDVEPLLLCDGCERLLHCDSQGERLYDNFTIYRL